MDVFTALEERRAVRAFNPDCVIPQAHITHLMQAVILSPTSFNIQNWRFVVVTDQNIKQELRAAAWDQAQLTDASVIIILCADLNAWDKNPQRYYAGTPDAVQKIILPMIDQYYRSKDQLQRDEAMRSCGIAAQSIMLAATDMGYDTIPMIGFDPARVADIIGLPADHVIGLMIALGQRAADVPPRTGKLPYDDVVFANRFSD